MTRRANVLSYLASEILLRKQPGTTLVGIDGVDGAGKTCFADELSAYFPDVAVIRASADGFHNPRAVRYARGRDSPLGYYQDSYNYGLLKRELLDPLRSQRPLPYRIAAFDHRTDSDVESPLLEEKTPAVLLFDGIFLHRPELAGYWHLSIFLEVSRRESLRRCNERDGHSGRTDNPDDPVHHRYSKGQDLYIAQCDPARMATWVVINDDLGHPHVLPAASLNKNRVYK